MSIPLKKIELYNRGNVYRALKNLSLTPSLTFHPGYTPRIRGSRYPTISPMCRCRLFTYVPKVLPYIQYLEFNLKVITIYPNLER